MLTAVFYLTVIAALFLVYRFIKASVAIILAVIISALLLGNTLMPASTKANIYNFFGVNSNLQ